MVKGQESRVENTWASLSETRASRGSLRGSGLKIPRLGETRLRGGLTLIELLIVIILLTTLVAAAIPLMAPTRDERRIREASRGVNAFITGAQMKAIDLQRPYGVALKKLSQDTLRDDPLELDNDNGVCVELFYVEQPPAFRGFDESSLARVALNDPPDPANSDPGAVRIQFVRADSGGTGPRSSPGNRTTLPLGFAVEYLPYNTVRPGDVVVIQGTHYRLTGPTLPGLTFYSGHANPRRWQWDILAERVNDTGQVIDIRHDNAGYPLGADRPPSPPAPAVPPTPYWTRPAPYKILRQPMPTSAEPYQLPDGMAIDLRASGVGSDDYFYWPNTHDNPYGPIIMFAPEGSVSRVIFDRSPRTDVPVFDEPVAVNLFLLVGRRVNIPPEKSVDDDPTLSAAGIPGPGVPNRAQILQDMRTSINWLRGDSRWVVIGAQSGRVVTTENALVDPAAVIDKYVDPPNVTERSEKLRTYQIIAAREFAADMRQEGGG